MKRSSLFFLLIAALTMQACASAAPTKARKPPQIAQPASGRGIVVDSAGPAKPSATMNPLCAGASTSDAFTDEVIALTNAERAKTGAGALTKNAILTSAAQSHTNDMACKFFLDHTGSDKSSPFDRMTRFGYNYSTAAENVAMGQQTPPEVVKGWMESPGHKANILNAAYTEIGVGYVNNPAENEANYNHYWTQKFGKP